VTADSVRRDLRAAIALYQSNHLTMSEHGRRVLERLRPRIAEEDEDYEDDRYHEVGPAFEATPPERWSNLLSACISAESEQREHKHVVEQVKRVVEKTEEAKDALETLEGFVKLLSASGHKSADWTWSPPWHPGEYFTEDHPEREAVRNLRDLILFAQRRAYDELQLHSQKTDVPASRLAGIGLIKAAIRTYAPKAQNWRKLAADLAMVVLDTGQVSENMVGDAKTLRQRLDRLDRKGAARRISGTKIVKTRRG
jgi:hypothetical protein